LVIPERQVFSALGPQAPQEESGIPSATLFARWFWFVYVPLGLFVPLLLLTFAGLLPRLAVAGLMVLSVWSAAAVRLLFERSRRGLAVPVPKNLVGGLSWVTGLAATGAVLGWMGLARLSSDLGLLLGFSGVFLMVLALIAPAFKLIDVIIRSGAKTVISRWLAAAKQAQPAAEPIAEVAPEEDVETKESAEAMAEPKVTDAAREAQEFVDDIVITRSKPRDIVITRYKPPVRRQKPRSQTRHSQEPPPDVEEAPPLRVGGQRR
jgi:hypothetical protein